MLSNPRPPAHGANALTTEPSLQVVSVIILTRMLMVGAPPPLHPPPHFPSLYYLLYLQTSLVTIQSVSA